MLQTAIQQFENKHQITEATTLAVLPVVSNDSVYKSFQPKRRNWRVTVHAWTKKGETEPRMPDTKYKLLRGAYGSLEVGDQYLLEPSQSRRDEMLIRSKHGQYTFGFTEGITPRQGKVGLFHDADHESHWEPADYPEKSKFYCSPDYDHKEPRYLGTPWYGKTKKETGHHIRVLLDWGKWPEPGKRDMSYVKAMVEDGATEKEILEEYCEMGYKLCAGLFVAVEKAIQKFRPRIWPDPNVRASRKVKGVFAFSGPSGHGKTTAAYRKLLKCVGVKWDYTPCREFENFNDINQANIEKYIWTIEPTMKYDDWATYDGQPCICIDDLNSETMPFKTLLAICLNRINQHNAKYGKAYNLAEYIAITSVDHFEDVYRSYCTQRHEDMTQLTRRIHKSYDCYSENAHLANQQKSSTPKRLCTDSLFPQVCTEAVVLPSVHPRVSPSSPIPSTRTKGTPRRKKSPRKKRTPLSRNPELQIKNRDGGLISTLEDEGLITLQTSNPIPV